MTREMLLKKLNSVKLVKARSKMIREALENGASEKGNHKIELVDTTFDEFTFVVSYRGTRIAQVHVRERRAFWLPIDAGEFENTPSTIRQRKDIAEALLEVSDVAANTEVI